MKEIFIRNLTKEVDLDLIVKIRIVNITKRITKRKSINTSINILDLDHLEITEIGTEIEMIEGIDTPIKIEIKEIDKGKRSIDRKRNKVIKRKWNKKGKKKKQNGKLKGKRNSRIGLRNHMN